MGSFLRSVVLAAAALSSTVVGARAQPSTIPHLASNSNQRAAGAGRRSGTTLTLHLVAARGEWHPEGPSSPAIVVAALGEEGAELSVPGPLVRVAEGTLIVATIRNALSEPLTIHGLITRPALADGAITIAPGMSRDVRFIAGAPGTYAYWGTSGPDVPLELRKAFDMLLGGAFIVDPRGGSAPDRVFVLNQWFERPHFLFGINGQSWPFTERLTANLGDRLHWRFVNLTRTTHPMHLHGFYFDVIGTGTPLTYERYGRDQTRHVVTENMLAGGAMEMRWVPERPGNWLLHCHLPGHVSPALRFWQNPAGDHTGQHGHDPTMAMAGLVLGITVSGDARTVTTSSVPPRRLTLAIHRRPNLWGSNAAYGFAIKKGDVDTMPSDITVPGPPLVLTRNQPAEITLENHLDEPTSIHWHGIELDSYYDGVAGFSGTVVNTTPEIAPGGSFVARFTPPRAGTFIYHTHSHDDHQLISGMYGAIVVLPPGETFDPAIDHLVILGGTGQFDQTRPDLIPAAVNGTPNSMITLKAGVANRLRLINIFAGLDLAVTLKRNLEPLKWLPIAKDGADLPRSQRVVRAASTRIIAVGETYDFSVVPTTPGTFWLDVLAVYNGRLIRQVPVSLVP